MSDAALAKIWDVLGIVRGVVDCGRVHFWEAGSVKETASTTIARLNTALPLFVPSGAEIAEIVTESMTFSFARHLGSRIHALRGRGPNPVRIVIRRPVFRGIVDVGPELGPNTLNGVGWKDGVPHARVTVTDITPWAEMHITVAQFDKAWSTSGDAEMATPFSSLERALERARQLSVSEDDLARVIHRFCDSVESDQTPGNS